MEVTDGRDPRACSRTWAMLLKAAMSKVNEVDASESPG